jgi:hypothetical protein
MKTLFFSFNHLDRKAQYLAEMIRERCQQYDFTLVMLPEPHTLSEQPLASTFDQIKQSALVISVMGENNANVLMELGYAMGMGKPLILIADLARGLPSGLALVPAINYQNPVEEIASVVRKVLEAHQRESRPLAESEVGLDLAEMLRLWTEYPEKFERIPYSAFEAAVKKEFARQGYGIAEINPQTDYGFDFKVASQGQNFLVEVKKISANGKVSISTVQQLLGAIHAYETPKALLICTSDFTDSARAYASRHAREVTLWTMNDLAKFVHGQLKI